MKRKMSIWLLGMMLALEMVDTARAIEIQPPLEQRVTNLENRWNSFRPDSGIGFLFGAFCALWAQNTKRNAWLWFFLGLIFTAITVLCLLYKNSHDLRKGPIRFA